MWADAVPNLLIGLRDGLAGALVVSILLATVRRSAANSAARPIWLGVLGGLILSLSVGAVLAFTTPEPSPHTVEGILSVIAVILLTGVRRTAPSAGVLAMAAFCTVGGVGLDSAMLVLAGSVPALIGIAVAVALCRLLYRWLIRIPVTPMAVVLIVITGGVLAYGIGGLQESLLVPGHSWLAFGLTGVTWLQFVGFVLYIGIALTVYFWAKPIERRIAWAPPPWIPIAAAVLVPLLLAGVLALVNTGGTTTATPAAAGRKAFPRMFAVPPLQPNELDVPIQHYQTYVAGQLVTMTDQVNTLISAVNGNDLAAARVAWLPAQLTWEKVGAAYGSFGDLAAAIDGGPQGLPDGVRDSGFTGLRRLEYGLWHDQPAATLAPIAAKLAGDIQTLRQKLPTLTENPKDMVIRAHEILEDALRDHLSGLSDQGAGTGFAETRADVDATRVVLDELAPLINERRAGIVDTVKSDLDTVARALDAAQHNGNWDSESTAPTLERERVNAAVGQELEDVSPVPDLLEIGAS